MRTRFQPLKAVATAAMVLLAAPACRTTSPGDESSGTLTSETDGDGIGSVLELGGSEEQDLYLRMLAVEAQAGIQPSRDRLHSSTGVARCKRGDVSNGCDLKVRLSETELSSAQTLAAPLAERLQSYMKAARADLADAPEIFADLTCDYVGSKVPPFAVERVDCRVSSPRSIDEAVFLSPIAEDLVELLRGDQTFDSASVTVSGTVTCIWLGKDSGPAAGKVACTTRAMTGGLLSDKVSEVGTRHASTVARRVRQAAYDRVGTAAPDASKPPAETSEVTASLRCEIKNLKLGEDSARRSFCVAKL
jgi:hypothetical protein